MTELLPMIYTAVSGLVLALIGFGTALIVTWRKRIETDQEQDASERAIKQARERAALNMVHRLDEQASSLLAQQKQMARLERSVMKMYYQHREQVTHLRHDLRKCLDQEE